MSEMEGFGLSQRGATNVAAVWPRISKAVEEREQKANANQAIDMGTSENMLIREELIEIYKKAVQEGLSSKVSYNQHCATPPPPPFLFSNLDIHVLRSGAQV